MQYIPKEANEYLRLVVGNFGSDGHRNQSVTKNPVFSSINISAKDVLKQRAPAEEDFRSRLLAGNSQTSCKTAGYLGEFFLWVRLYQLAHAYQTRSTSWGSLVRSVEALESENALAAERAHAMATNNILSNILPPNIRDRLINGEKRIADRYDNVSVLFVDIVGFTELATKIEADDLIDVLDRVFTKFDTICKRHGLEKIKTIGDAYMAVCGAPIAYDNHAERAASAALEMLEECSGDAQIGVDSCEIEVDLIFRIGLHSGSVVAGILGENKYAYDVWGDAVNTASRMESYGESGKIHVSQEFVRAIGAASANFHFTPRGEMLINGKGSMKTYFLERSG